MTGGRLHKSDVAWMLKMQQAMSYVASDRKTHFRKQREEVEEVRVHNDEFSVSTLNEGEEFRVALSVENFPYKAL
jgi:hypothetical protein